MAVAAMFMALCSAFFGGGEPDGCIKRGMPMTAAILAVTAALTAFLPEPSVQSAFGGMFYFGEGARYLKLLALLAAFISVPLISGYYRRHAEEYVPEMPALLLLAVLGIMLICSARNFLALYVSVELTGLASYVLAALHRDDARASEAGVKYFVTGAIASCILLFGISLIYGATNGGLNYEDAAFVFSSAQGLFNAGAALVCAGLFFKISAVPFHAWTPDVYQGAPKPSAAFFAIAGKLAGAAALVNLCAYFFYPLDTGWRGAFAVIGLLSVFGGAFGAIRQDDIRRMIAFSSVGHMGYILLGLSAGSADALQAVLLYLTIYVTLSAGFFACVMLIQSKQNGAGESVYALAGLARTRPMAALGISVILLSLAGIPPFAGFFAKFMLFKALVAQGYIIIAAAGILASAVAAFYYLRVIKIMYFDAPEEGVSALGCGRAGTVLAAGAVFNAVFIFLMDGFLAMTLTAAQSMR